MRPFPRIGWGDDPRGGRVGTLARSYQGLIALAHRQAFFQVAYNSLRAGRALCYGDLAFALSGTAESVRKVHVWRHVNKEGMGDGRWAVESRL